MDRAIRQARPEEAALLTDLAFRSKAYWGYDEAFMEACRDDIRVTESFIARGHTFVHEAGGTVQGVYALVPRDGGEVDLDLLYVEPAAIGTGVGRRLWAHAVERARLLGFTRMHIPADPNAEPFYLRMGARRVGETPSTAIPGRMLPHLAFDLQG